MSDSNKQDQAFLDSVRATLDLHAEELDGDTLRDLRLARAQALYALHRPRRIWQPVALGALAATLAVVAVTITILHAPTPGVSTGIEDMSLLSAGDDLDLYENLEFYQWLELVQHNG